MTPPPTAALALLGIWAAVVFWAMSTTTTVQSPAEDRFVRSVAETGSDRSDGSSDGPFPASDD